MYDLLLFIHILSAFVLMAGAICQVPWVVMKADGAGVERMFRVGGLMAAVGGTAALVFGLLLVWDAEYRFFTLWVVGAIVLWLIGTGTGERVARVDRDKGTPLLLTSTAMVVLILVLMIWKPGA